MSRRQREERIKAAAPKRDVYMRQQAEAAATGRPAGRGSGWRWKLLVAVMVAVTVAGALVYALVIEPWWDRRQLLGQSGQPRGAAFGDGVVALFDAVDVEHEDRDDPRRNRRIDKTRVTVLDLATGAQVARHLFEGAGGCVAASAGRLWCDLGPLAVHDAHTFARLARADQRIAAAGLGRLVGERWRVTGAVASWALDDGRAAAVDAATLEARVADQTPRELRPHPVTGDAPVDGALAPLPGCDGGAMARMTGLAALTAGGVTWTVEDRGGRAAIRRKGAPAPTTTFLAPTLLAAADGAPLVLHHSSIEPARDHPQLSRLGPAGDAAWTVDLRRGCVAWRLDGTSLVVVTEDPGRRALAIDVASGAIRWAASR